MERDKILGKNSNNRDVLINKRLLSRIEVCEVDKDCFIIGSFQYFEKVKGLYS